MARAQSRPRSNKQVELEARRRGAENARRAIAEGKTGPARTGPRSVAEHAADEIMAGREPLYTTSAKGKVAYVTDESGNIVFKRRGGLHGPQTPEAAANISKSDAALAEADQKFLERLKASTERVTTKKHLKLAEAIKTEVQSRRVGPPVTGETFKDRLARIAMEENPNRSDAFEKARASRPEVAAQVDNFTEQQIRHERAATKPGKLSLSEYRAQQAKAEKQYVTESKGYKVQGKPVNPDVPGVKNLPGDTGYKELTDAELAAETEGPAMAKKITLGEDPAVAATKGKNIATPKKATKAKGKVNKGTKTVTETPAEPATPAESAASTPAPVKKGFQPMPRKPPDAEKLRNALDTGNTKGLNAHEKDLYKAVENGQMSDGKAVETAQQMAADHAAKAPPVTAQEATTPVPPPAPEVLAPPAEATTAARATVPESTVAAKAAKTSDILSTHGDFTVKPSRAATGKYRVVGPDGKTLSRHDTLDMAQLEAENAGGKVGQIAQPTARTSPIVEPPITPAAALPEELAGGAGALDPFHPAAGGLSGQLRLPGMNAPTGIGPSTAPLGLPELPGAATSTIGQDVLPFGAAATGAPASVAENAAAKGPMAALRGLFNRGGNAGGAGAAENLATDLAGTTLKSTPTFTKAGIGRLIPDSLLSKLPGTVESGMGANLASGTGLAASLAGGIGGMALGSVAGSAAKALDPTGTMHGWKQDASQSLGGLATAAPIAGGMLGIPGVGIPLALGTLAAGAILPQIFGNDETPMDKFHKAVQSAPHLGNDEKQYFWQQYKALVDSGADPKAASGQLTSSMLDYGQQKWQAAREEQKNARFLMSPDQAMMLQGMYLRDIADSRSLWDKQSGLMQQEADNLAAHTSDPALAATIRSNAANQNQALTQVMASDSIKRLLQPSMDAMTAKSDQMTSLQNQLQQRQLSSILSQVFPTGGGASSAGSQMPSLASLIPQMQGASVGGGGLYG